MVCRCSAPSEKSALTDFLQITNESDWVEQEGWVFSFGLSLEQLRANDGDGALLILKQSGNLGLKFVQMRRLADIRDAD